MLETFLLRFCSVFVHCTFPAANRLFYHMSQGSTGFTAGDCGHHGRELGRMRAKLYFLLENQSRPLQDTITAPDRYHRSLLPAAVRLHNKLFSHWTTHTHTPIMGLHCKLILYTFCLHYFYSTYYLYCVFTVFFTPFIVPVHLFGLSYYCFYVFYVP